MYYINAKPALRTLHDLLGKLSAREIGQGVSRAINHSLQKVRTEARTEVKRVYNIGQRYLSGIDLKRASTRHLEGQLLASRKPIPLDAFNPKFEGQASTIRVTRKGEQKVRNLRRKRQDRGQGVTVEVKRGQTERIPFAFMIPGAKPRVFARGQYGAGTSHGFIQRHKRESNDGNDTPIKPLITVSVFGSIVNDDVSSSLGRKVEAHYPARLVHELSYLISKAASSTAPTP
jgi:hypothetical protein